MTFAATNPRSTSGVYSAPAAGQSYSLSGREQAKWLKYICVTFTLQLIFC